MASAARRVALDNQLIPGAGEALLIATVGVLQTGAIRLVEAQTVGVDNVGLLACFIIVAVIRRAKWCKGYGFAIALSNDSTL